MRNQYLKDNEIKEGFWYIDKKGQEWLYLGKGFWYWEFGGNVVVRNTEVKNLYLKRKDAEKLLGKSFLNENLEEILKEIVTKRPNMITLSKANKKFINEGTFQGDILEKKELKIPLDLCPNDCFVVYELS